MSSLASRQFWPPLGLAKNPWHVAKNRADKAGVIVAVFYAQVGLR